MPKSKLDVIGDIAALDQAVAKSGFDAVIAVSPENVRYAGDVCISTQASIRDRLAFVIWPAGRDPIFLVCLIEAGFVRRESWIQDVRTYQEFITDPMDALADLLCELKIENSHVAIETEYLAAKYYNRLTKRLPSLRISEAEPLFAGVRMFKTPKELEIIVGAFNGTEKAFVSTYSSIQVGDTEKQISMRLADNILQNGAEMVAFNHLNCGANTGFPHMAASNYRVKKGDIVKADSGGFFKEYYSNVGRTAKLGEPTTAESDAWKHLRDIHHTIIDMCRPGRVGCELFAKAKEMQIKAGLPFTYSHNGPSLGLNVHESPIISSHENIPYQAGMITTVETRHRDVGKLGLHMEDIIEITDKGPIWHARFFKNEEIFVI